MEAQTAIIIGNVYRIASGQFGIVRYAGTGTVTYVALLDADTVTEACEELARDGWRFERADRDTEAWGRVTFKAQGNSGELFPKGDN